MRVRPIDLAVWSVVVTFGALVAVGIASSLWELIHTAHPYLSNDYLVYDDALQLYTGHTLYQDPATGYVASLYTVGDPALVSVLLHFYLWTGWGILLSAMSGLVLVGLVAVVAYRPDRDALIPSQAFRVAEAAGIGFVGWWIVTTNPYPMHYQHRPDVLSWALGIAGLMLTPRALRGSRGAWIGAIALLSGAFWVKQPAAAAAVAAGLWGIYAIAIGVTTWRRLGVFLGALAAVNLFALAFQQVITDGWTWFYIFELGRRHDWSAFGYVEVLRRSWAGIWLPVLAAATMLLVGIIGRARAGGASLRRDADGQLLVLLVLFLVVTLSSETYLQRMQGGHENHLIGQTWALVLLVGLGWRWAGRTGSTRLASGAVVAVLLGLGMTQGAIVLGMPDYGTVQAWQVPKVHDVVRFKEDAMATVLPRGQILDQLSGELGMRDGRVPINQAACGLVAAGLSSLVLERDIANRRYPFIVPWDPDVAQSCSAFGKWEENYFWKLDRMVKAGYRPNTRGLPQPILERRPGPGAAASARDLLRCFAPFRLGGVLFRIGRGGGLWCQRTPTDPHLILRETPAEVSEVLTDGVVTAIDGSLIATLPAGTGTVVIAASLGGLVNGKVQPLVQLDAEAPDRPTTAVITLGRVPADVPAGAIVRQLDPAAVEGTQLRIYATTGSGARLDFSHVRIRTKDGIERGAVTRRGL
ncbi:MAG TPA: hypothetical protein VFY45_12540 [Baekduia sp.]|nr:hypothetical protein [Baekduia sp.]